MPASERLLERGARRRRAIVRFLRAYHDEHGQWPTFNEIATGVGLRSANAVRDHILTLEAHGAVIFANRKERYVELPPPRVHWSSSDGW